MPPVAAQLSLQYCPAMRTGRLSEFPCRKCKPHPSRLAAYLILGCLSSGLTSPAGSEDTNAYPRISEEAFQARLPFFDYDKSIPLEGRIVQEWKQDGRLRQKIVFRGAQGFLVPGYIEFPGTNQKPWRLVLLLHGWSGGKDNWYEDDNYINGGLMRKALLGSGYATLALDAATHGERSNEIDYQHVNSFDDPKAAPRRNYFTFAEISIQTVKDYRRALDLVYERGMVDTNGVGLVGYSMGGMDSFYLLAVEPLGHVERFEHPHLLEGPVSQGLYRRRFRTV